MSYIKSSLFYLKDINDFLKEKHDQYLNFNNYLKQLTTNEKEVIPFLERVIMNKHNYDLNKERFSKELKGDISFSKALKILLIILEIVIIIALLAMFFTWYFDKNNSSQSFINKFKVGLMYIIVILLVNLLATWMIRGQQYNINDQTGNLTKAPQSEEIFTAFDLQPGIAMYYALKRNFSEPITSSNRKTLKTLFGKYTSTVKTDKGSINTYPTVSDIIGKYGNDWKNITKSIEHSLTTVFEKPVYDPNDSTKIIGYKSLYDEIDKQLRYSDNITMMKELVAQGDNLKSYVLNNIQLGGSLTNDDVKNIITTEIVPLFNFKSVLTQIPGWNVKDEKSLQQIESPFEVSSNIECMLNCEVNDTCLVAALDMPSKKCTMYSNQIPMGNKLKYDSDKTLFVKNNEKGAVFLEGSGLVSEHSSQIWDVDGKTSECANDCLAGQDCVKYIQDKDGKCHKYLSNSPIDPKNIITNCEEGKCQYFKKELGTLGKTVDSLYIFTKSQDLLKAQLLEIMKRNRFQFNIRDQYVQIKDALTSKYGAEFIQSLGEKIVDLFDAVQTSADMLNKGSKSSPSPKYINSDSFVRVFDKLTYKDFGSIYYSTSSLSNVVESLNSMVQSDIANNMSADDNIFLAQERQTNTYKYFIINISILLVLGYVYYAISNTVQTGGGYIANVRNASKKAFNTSKNMISDVAVDRYFKFLVPMVFISFAIVIMVSWYKKTLALNTYNREVLEKNGGNLVASCYNLKKVLDEMQDEIVSTKKQYSFETLLEDMSIESELKKDLYDNMIQTLELLEKCNLLMDGADITLPFPWVDVSINLMIIVICVIVLMKVMYEMSPITLLGDIRELNINAKRIINGETPDLSKLNCDDSEDMGMTLKIIGFVIFVMIIVLFSMKLLRSSENYKMGLYNSKYYKDSKCAH